MRYYRLSSESGDRLVAHTGGTAYDLTSAHENIEKFTDLARAADVSSSDTDIDGVATRLAERADAVELAVHQSDMALPVVASEVWAAGVTYEASSDARDEESDQGQMYLDVYNGERPEIFFKATPDRTSGPGDAVGIRADSTWDVPEPELTVVIYRGSIVGFTVGNDMSSRSIEGDNPLYLPQAKIYENCCALGPCVTTLPSIDDPHELTLSMEIEREGETVYDGTTSTSQMVRSCEELVSYFTRHNSVPELSVLMTGTSLVPEDGFTLEDGDLISISIEDIGTLENTVETV
jgi:2-dehydro-3-deoxy-D-arabinonate dehydratase